MTPTREEYFNALKERHGEALHARFSAASAAICGLGGLGSNIAVSLARAGVGRLILIDFDQVDISNLHRQQYKAAQVGLDKTKALSDNLLEIAPYIELESYAGQCRIGASSGQIPHRRLRHGRPWQRQCYPDTPDHRPFLSLRRSVQRYFRGAEAYGSPGHALRRPSGADRTADFSI